MPADVKAEPSTVTEAAASETTLEGWVPALASPGEVRDAFAKAFDYRGDVTLTLKDGRELSGFVYDRRGPAGAEGLDGWVVRMMPAEVAPGEPEKVDVPFAEITRVVFSGKDTAAGKSFEKWIERYREKKLAELKAKQEAGAPAAAATTPDEPRP